MNKINNINGVLGDDHKGHEENREGGGDMEG